MARAVHSAVLKDMVELPAGTFRMGDERFYPEEQPVREVSLEGFWIDRHPVTVAEFRRFVKATGHRDPVPALRGGGQHLPAIRHELGVAPRRRGRPGGA